MGDFDGIERQRGGEAELGVIWLHGLGADAGDFLPIVDALELPCGTRFVFPNAPFRAVTINGGMRMRAWYDIVGFGPDVPDDTAGITASARLVQELVDRETERGLGRDRIVLAGFSQGGAVVLHAGLGDSRPVAGIMGLSTYLPAPSLLGLPGRLAATVPVWLAHGSVDPVIPLALAEHSARLLIAGGIPVEWSTYVMGHEVKPAEIADISAWLARIAAR